MTPDDYKHVAQLLHNLWPPVIPAPFKPSTAGYEAAQFFPYNPAIAAIEDLSVREQRPTLRDLIEWARARGWVCDERVLDTDPWGSPMSHQMAEEHVYGQRYVFEQYTPPRVAST